jgi:hypothetical protein
VGEAGGYLDLFTFVGAGGHASKHDRQHPSNTEALRDQYNSRQVLHDRSTAIMNTLGERILRIDPPQRCVSCHRLTTVAIAMPTMEGSKQLQINPECWLHGYFEVSPQEEKASVERFVVGYYHGQGSASVLKSVEVSEVPGYRPDKQEVLGVMYVKERCWLVRYVDPEGSNHDAYVVWSFSRLSFLLRDPARYAYQQKLKADKS